MSQSIFYLFLYCLLTACTIVCSGCARDVEMSDKLRGLLNEIDSSFKYREDMIDARARNIAELRDSIRASSDYDERIRLYGRLIDEGRHFQIDSMLMYYSEAKEDALAHGDIENVRKYEIGSMELMPLKIRMHEAIVAIDTTDVSALSKSNRIAFYKSARQVYIYFTTIYSHWDVNMELLERVGEFSRLLVSELAEEDDGYFLYKATADIADNNLSLSIATLRDYLSGIDASHPNFIDATGMLALAYFRRERYDDWAYCIALTALVENQRGYIDGEALKQLGRWVYESGDASRAYDYIVIAEENEVRSGAVVRSVHVSDAMPFISNAYRESERNSIVLLCIIIGCMIVILILVGVLFYRRARERAELADAKDELARANATKEVYLGRFLSLCYIYMDKMQDVCKVVSRKLAAGQTEELYHLMRTGKLEDEQKELFYREFDEAFINIYPTFIRDVNALMKDGFKLGDENAGHLTPELRILAFMRLGLDDSSKIARFLNLSVNTVYTYRNRMKNRASDRDNFEIMVMEIGRL